MASARDIKRRIKSVKSTQQITKAMKMVSAAKLRKAQAAVTAVRPFTRKIDQMIAHVGGSVEHPYLTGKADVQRVCYVVLGSDRGLCGGFNANLHRFTEQVLKAEQRAYTLVVVGQRVRDYMSRRSYPIDTVYEDVGDNPSFNSAQLLSAQLMKAFDDGAYDEVHLIYSEFRSSMSQTPVQKRLLPVEQPEDDGEENMFAAADYIFEPDRESILRSLLPQYVDIGVYCALQEAKASEHGARMSAMSNATNNATEMIDHLTLSLNRARQSAITTEIIEIVSGAAALQ